MHSEEEDFIFLECLDKTFDGTGEKELLIIFVKLLCKKRGRRNIEAGDFVARKIESRKVI
jgi:hypothetical protein